MILLRSLVFAGVASALLASCKDTATEVESSDVMQVGETAINQAVLDHWFAERSADGVELNDARRAELKTELGALMQRAEWSRKSGLLEEPAGKIAQLRFLASQSNQVVREKSQTTEPTEAQLEELFRSLSEYQAKPEQRRFAALWLPGDEARSMSLTTARDFYQKQGALFLGKLESGFGSLAVDHSFHRPTRYQGGVMDWATAEAKSGIRRAAWQQKAVDVAFQLSIGEVSEVVKLPKGGEILVLLIAVEEGRATSFKEVLPMLKKRWIQGERKRLEKNFNDSLDREFPISAP